MRKSTEGTGPNGESLNDKSTRAPRPRLREINALFALGACVLVAGCGPSAPPISDGRRRSRRHGRRRRRQRTYNSGPMSGPGRCVSPCCMCRRSVRHNGRAKGDAVQRGGWAGLLRRRRVVRPRRRPKLRRIGNDMRPIGRRELLRFDPGSGRYIQSEQRPQFSCHCERFPARSIRGDRGEAQELLSTVSSEQTLGRSRSASNDSGQRVGRYVEPGAARGSRPAQVQSGMS